MTVVRRREALDDARQEKQEFSASMTVSRNTETRGSDAVKSGRSDAERVLRKTDQLFRATFELAAVGITHVALNGRFLRANREFSGMLGYSQQELTELTFQQVTLPADLQRDLVQVQRLLAGEADTFSMDKRYVRKDGKIIWAGLTVSLVRTPEGAPDYFISVIEPLEDRKKLEQELRESEARHRVLLESMVDGVFVAQDQRLVFSNLALPAMLGYSHQELLERPVADLLAPESLHLWNQTLSMPHGHTGQTSRAYDLRFRYKGDARPVWLELRATHTQFDGRPAVLGVTRDVTERKDAERIAREQVDLEERLATVTATAQGVIHSYRQCPDGSFSFPYAAPGIEDLYGVSADELKRDGRRAGAAVHPEDRQRLREIVDASARQMSPFRAEFRVRNPVRGELWVEAHSIPRSEADGSIVWNGFLYDVTERKRTERKLLHYASLVESSDDAIIGTTVPGMITSWNPGAEKIFGYAESDALGHPIGLILPSDRTHEADMVRSAIVRGEVLRNFQTVRRRKDGSLVDVSITMSPLRDSLGSIIGGSAIIRDITASKRAEQRALLQTEAILDLANDAVIILDPANVIIYWNEGAERLYGWKSQEAVGQLGDRLLRTVFPRPRAEIDEICRQDAHWEGELEHRRRDGSIVTVSSRWTVQRDEFGAVHRVLEINNDITARKRAELEIAALNSHLRARTEELEAYTYSVSHDLKAPLRGIEGYSRLLLEDHATQLDPEGRFFLQTIRKETGRMAELIDDLLAYSRVDRGEIRLASVELRSLIGALVAERDDDLRREGTELSLDIDCDMVTAETDGLALALRNLIDNAIKFSRSARPARIEIGARQTEAGTSIWVRDNGIGFDMRFHDKIFEIFQRLQDVEQYPGTGLGLAIVRKAMERMRGRVWAESTPAQGATFHLELPVVPIGANARLGQDVKPAFASQ